MIRSITRRRFLGNASALNEFLMLGNVATQFEETLEFDRIAMKIVNNAAADALLRSDYREGWIL